MDGHQGTVTSAMWSFDGRRVVSGSSDGTVRVWRVYKRKYVCKEVLEGHNGRDAGGGDGGNRTDRVCVNSVAWSSDNGLVVSGSMDEEAGTSVIVWKPQSSSGITTTMAVAAVGNELIGEETAGARTDCSSEEMPSVVLATRASVPRRYRANFIHARNNTPMEMIAAEDATIGFSVHPHGGKTSMHVCSINPRRGYALSKDRKTIHILERIGGGGMCVDCVY